jgi:hypothetical protein
MSDLTDAVAIFLNLAEETRQDQREDASPAGAHTPLQQGAKSCKDTNNPVQVIL